jgi:hypothetical protein
MTSRLTTRRTSGAFLALVLGLLLSLVAAPTVSAAGGRVLPPRARPHGYSLSDMTKAAAAFTASGNDLQLYPDTPFQILYSANFKFDPDGTGLLVTGSNSFPGVSPGTTFYVPLQNADDSPPIAGVYPTTTRDAEHYFFDSSQLGGRGFEIVVDGQSKSVGASYLSGPVTTPPLPDGGGTHMITLGVFLTPMRPGTHSVTIRGGLFGDAIAAVLDPLTFFRFEFTYTIEVVPK